MNKLEVEIKYQLKKEDFIKFKDYISKKYEEYEVIRQENHYLESSDFKLDKLGVSSRLRNIENMSYEFTIKTKKALSENNLHVKDEYSVAITREVFEEILEAKDIYYVLKKYKLLENYPEVSVFEDCSILGCLATERRVYKYYMDSNIIFDISSYLDKVDYEIEIEDSMERLEAIELEVISDFSRHFIMPIKNFDSKTKRFKKELKKMLLECK